MAGAEKKREREEFLQFLVEPCLFQPENTTLRITVTYNTSREARCH